MKRFVGLVNGKSFDNEWDFNEAARKAIQENGDVLSISSYYAYTNDTEQEEVKEKDNSKYLASSEYILLAEEPEVVDKNFNYPISEDLKQKILEASNDKDIKENAQRLIAMYKEQVKNDENEMKVIMSQIDKLQTKLYDKETTIKKLQAKQEYYNNILDILSEKKKEEDEKKVKEEKEEKVEESVKDENKPLENEDIRKIFGSTSLYDTLRRLGLRI